jgi:hypothetical protein
VDCDRQKYQDVGGMFVGRTRQGDASDERSELVIAETAEMKIRTVSVYDAMTVRVI